MTIDSSVPSDQALESLLAQTRADLAARATSEVDRVSQDLENLLYRVRGSRRASRAASLRGLGRPGAGETASSPRQGEAPAAPTQPLTPTSQPLAGADLEMMGVPPALATMHPANLDELVGFISVPPAPRAHRGRIVAVVGSLEVATQTVITAQRVARRIPGPAHVVLGGAKTLLPGTGMRARSGEDLDRALKSTADATLVLALIDSPAPGHARVTERLAEHADPALTWAVIDAAQPRERTAAWLGQLPGGLKANRLAAFQVWEATYPAAVLGYGTVVAMLDTAPARRDVWRAVLDERLRRARG